jgi:hypothetical protein
MLPEKKLTELNMTWTAFRTPIIELGFGERSYYFKKKIFINLKCSNCVCAWNIYQLIKPSTLWKQINLSVTLIRSPVLSAEELLSFHIFVFQLQNNARRKKNQSSQTLKQNNYTRQLKESKNSTWGKICSILASYFWSCIKLVWVGKIIKLHLDVCS